MHNPRCPECGNVKTIKWGSRNGRKRYRCPDGHNFSINRRKKSEPVWTKHLAGNSIRTIAGAEDAAVGKIAGILKQELAALPRNELITKQYCTRFGGVACVDGVYVKIKGLPKAIPFIYAIDFVTHDPVAGILDFAENEVAFARLFLILKGIGYPLRFVVADEAPALKVPLQRIFPAAEVQLCHVHILRNIRKFLHVTEANAEHLPFFRAMQKLLAMEGEVHRRSFFNDLARSQLLKDGEWEVLKSIRSRWEDLFRYESIRKQGITCPRTNNLIEGYNNHFKSRVNAIKGFESISSAERWLNAWLLRRRFTPFRECGKPFEHLNGKTSFSQTRNPDLPWPEISGISPEIPT